MDYLKVKDSVARPFQKKNIYGQSYFLDIPNLSTTQHLIGQSQLMGSKLTSG